MSVDKVSRSSAVEVNKIEHFAQSEYQGQYQQVILPISNHLHDYHYHHSQTLVTAGQQYYNASKQPDPAPEYHYENGTYYHPLTHKNPQKTLHSTIESPSNKVLSMTNVEKPTRTDKLYIEDQIVNVDRVDAQTLTQQVSAPRSTSGWYCNKNKPFFKL